MKNKTMIIVIVIIGIILLIPKTSFFSIYKSTSKIEVYNNVASNPVKTKISFIEPYTIVFHGLNDSIDTIKNNSNYNIDVYVEKETSLGSLRYLPIYKPVSFESKVSYKWNYPVTDQSNPLQKTEIAKFNISGNYNVFGICTTNKVEQLIENLINNSIRSKIQKDIKKSLSKN